VSTCQRTSSTSVELLADSNNSSLAHAEIYMVLAAVFRRFSFELYETDVSDVRMAHDFFIPSPKLDSKGVRVKVIGINE
jgi:hypothetical protein